MLQGQTSRRALKSVLSAKASEENVVVIDEIKMDSIKTKTFKTFLNAVGADCKALVVTAENNEAVVKSAANIPGVQVASVFQALRVCSSSRRWLTSCQTDTHAPES